MEVYSVKGYPKSFAYLKTDDGWVQVCNDTTLIIAKDMLDLVEKRMTEEKVLEKKPE